MEITVGWGHCKKEAAGPIGGWNKLMATNEFNLGGGWIKFIFLGRKIPLNK